MFFFILENSALELCFPAKCRENGEFYCQLRCNFIIGNKFELNDQAQNRSHITCTYENSNPCMENRQQCYPFSWKTFFFR
jgi:hypothetical protein